MRMWLDEQWPEWRDSLDELTVPEWIAAYRDRAGVDELEAWMVLNKVTYWESNRLRREARNAA